VNGEPSIDEYFGELMDGGFAAPIDERKVVALVREYLAATRRFLADLHHSGGSGREVNELHTKLIDRLVRRLFWFAEETFFTGGGESQTELAVVAVGGYARREMSIYSDVDLLFLHRDTVTPFVRTITERLQYWMWDAALQVGCATRTISETIGLAKQDMTVFTSILNPRLLAGSGVLFHEFSKTWKAVVLDDPEKFIDEQLLAARARHTNYGDSLYLLQPNVKDGEGALRDYHVAYWVTQAIQPSTRWVEEFLDLGLLTEEELLELCAALDFLWRIRNELHLVSGRKNDQMSFELQEKMSVSLGYADSDGSELPVERFMRDFYRYARAIRNRSSLIIEQCQARVRRAPQRRQIKEVEHGFRIAEGQLEIPHGHSLREAPLDLLNVFAVAQKHDVPLTRKALRLVRQNLYLIDDAFRRDPRAVAIFEGILESEIRVMRTLMVMNDIGVLAAFLPEWEHIVCRWQHVMYHTYTVDVHTIFLVEELRRLWKGKYERSLPELTDLMRSVDDRVALFLGCMFHDIGKGLGGDHSVTGAIQARACTERLGFSKERADRVAFLVENHLVMSRLAQSRDLSDPKLIVEFARTVGDRARLRDLYLLTCADIRASSATAWSSWKGQLLQELFERTSEFLETGSDEKSTAIELIERRVETRRQGAAAELKKMGVSESKVDAYFDMMPHRYFTAHAPRQIARHALVVLDLASDKVLSTAFREMRGDFSEFILCARDVHGLYSKVAGVLTSHNFNILASHVYTTRSGLALEVYRVVTPPGGEGERRMAWADFNRSLETVLIGEIDVDTLMERQGRRVHERLRPLAANPARVRVTNEESDFYTIADIVADDRIGLLHALTRVIADLDHEIYISKAATVLDQVQDTFYLKDSGGKKIQDPEAVETLRVALQVAAQGDEAGGADG
jgi:[protein-PII] uridylyltransferase